MKTGITISPRRLEVLKLIAKGYSNEEISHSLQISIHTVKSHVETIFYYFHAKNRLEVVIAGLKQKFITIEDLL